MTDRSESSRAAFRDFAEREIKPYALQMDKDERYLDSLLGKMSKSGFLGATIPVAFGGKGWNQHTYGILTEEIGKVCSSTRSLLTVHLSLVAETILKWGTREQKNHWLPLLAGGKKIAAFGLTEPGAGSDAKGITSTYAEHADHFVLNGTKRWITFGAIADLFLVLAANQGHLSAFLVERNRPGVRVNPISGMLGTRASMLAEIRFEGCLIPRQNLLGSIGAGFSFIASTALDSGRFSVAMGTLGLAKACLEECTRYVSKRKQFGQYLGEHQLIRRKITDMVTRVNAAALLCYNVAGMRDAGDPNAILQTMIAKYFVTTAAAGIASEAVQIHGANGCHENAPVAMFYRDSKIMEIIEGTSELQQVIIAEQALQDMDSAVINDFYQ